MLVLAIIIFDPGDFQLELIRPPSSHETASAHPGFP
jgi:hypothetical protein